MMIIVAAITARDARSKLKQNRKPMSKDKTVLLHELFLLKKIQMRKIRAVATYQFK